MHVRSWTCIGARSFWGLFTTYLCPSRSFTNSQDGDDAFEGGSDDGEAGAASAVDDDVKVEVLSPEDITATQVSLTTSYSPSDIDDCTTTAPISQQPQCTPTHQLTHVCESLPLPSHSPPVTHVPHVPQIDAIKEINEVFQVCIHASHPPAAPCSHANVSLMLVSLMPCCLFQ